MPTPSHLVIATCLLIGEGELKKTIRDRNNFETTVCALVINPSVLGAKQQKNAHQIRNSSGQSVTMHKVKNAATS